MIRLDDLPESGCYVYRLYDNDDELFYIGASRSVRRRIETHSKNLPNLSRVSLEAHLNAEDMFTAEAAAIREARPRLNGQHNPDHQRSPGAAELLVELPADPPLLSRRLASLLLKIVVADDSSASPLPAAPCPPLRGTERC